MSTLKALHLAAPSLRERRAHSQNAVVEQRRRLAARTPSQEQAAVDPTAAVAEVFYDPSLATKVERSAPKRATLVGAMFFGVSCGVALALIVVT